MRHRTLLASFAVCLVAAFAMPSAPAVAATACGDLSAADARAAGCPPAGMMGDMPGVMGGGTQYDDGMMGRDGSMMGGRRSHDDGTSTAQTIMIVLMALLVAAVLVAVTVLLTRRSAGTPTAPSPPSAPSAGA